MSTMIGRSGVNASVTWIIIWAAYGCVCCLCLLISAQQPLPGDLHMDFKRAVGSSILNVGQSHELLVVCNCIVHIGLSQ